MQTLALKEEILAKTSTIEESVVTGPMTNSYRS